MKKVIQYNWVIVILLFIISEILIYPLGEFPLNDDVMVVRPLAAPAGRELASRRQKNLLVQDARRGTVAQRPFAESMKTRMRADEVDGHHPAEKCRNSHTFA